MLWNRKYPLHWQCTTREKKKWFVDFDSFDMCAPKTRWQSLYLRLCAYHVGFLQMCDNLYTLMQLSIYTLGNCCHGTCFETDFPARKHTMSMFNIQRGGLVIFAYKSAFVNPLNWKFWCDTPIEFENIFFKWNIDTECFTVKLIFNLNYSVCFSQQKSFGLSKNDNVFNLTEITDKNNNLWMGIGMYGKRISVTWATKSFTVTTIIGNNIDYNIFEIMFCRSHFGRRHRNAQQHSHDFIIQNE